MTAQTAIWFGFAAVLIILGGVLGSVERRERFVFVIGIVFVLVGLTVRSTPRLSSVILVVGGIGAVFASSVSLLR